QFVDDKANITFWNTSSVLGFFVNAPMVRPLKKGMTASDRTLSFSVNEDIYTIVGKTPDARDPDAILKCASISSVGAAEKPQVEIKGAIGYIGILVRILRKESASSVFGIDDNELKIVGGNGWVKLTRDGLER